VIARVGRRRWPRWARAEEGQGLVEFSVVVVVFTLILLGMLEFGFVFDHTISLSYASREGARIGAALVNGGGPLGCGTGRSPNAADVDPLIVAAIERVLTAPGSPIGIDQVVEIRIYRATSTGAEVSGSVNVWHYTDTGGSVTVDGEQLDFEPVAEPWAVCTRSNALPAQSIGISLLYQYHYVTPLGSIASFFGHTGPGPTTLPISDRTVMAFNPTN
jgi:hypothetical protein